MDNLFEPQLSLLPQGDGKYILKAETLTPNTCYVAGEAVQELPPNKKIIIPEALPVTLRIKVLDREICGFGITPVRHRIANLELGPGKNVVVAFATVDGGVVGSARIRPEEADSGEEPIDTSDWKAWVDRMPGPGTPSPSLFVEGTVRLPNPCYSVQLVKADNQEDPSSLTLDLQISEPSRPCIQVVTDRTVRYEDENYTGNHDYVIIQLADGSTIRVEIDTVS